MLRFLYEYGPYVGRREYPRLFRFETEAEWRGEVAIDAGREGLEFIVSALTPDQVRGRFPSCGFRRTGPEGSRLLAIVRAAAPGVR